ncbi:RpiR family transcriptional regulator [Agrilactobacillus composti DSM 18527 = JCM 14202]|uniref:RpiR family transcriptional regulator n=1 Tax=Agrilactobacillus composti DSM 18527 = JCM 14202 TaxID=1423734 RepID=X0PCM5_9LACO|nr:MurR/RpiR family transcriptional regulator [Agrilactobacillus composti]KRM30667.1 RpiR family transcriptional regulator [Agrilactobacillus composti DSM 18527 = JCM 14202]GAF38238.1 transcriptional regulator [Agrilactobacillus composti DSM 18527 = JCM 14202]
MLNQAGKDIPNIEVLVNRLSKVATESGTYEKIARYIEKNYNEIVFLTAIELSKVVGVSQGSISRFCIQMGYKGYNDFLRYLQKVVSTEMTMPRRLKVLDRDNKDSNSNILGQEIDNIQELQEVIQQDAYQSLVNVITNSDKLVLISDRMSETLMPYMYYILDKLRPNIYQVRPGTASWDNLELNSTKGVTILTILLPRYSKIMVNKLKSLHEAGYAISGITDSRLSPLMQLADNPVITPITTSSVFDVYSTPILLINLLVRDAAKKLPNIKDRLKQIENQNIKNDVFYS